VLIKSSFYDQEKDLCRWTVVTIPGNIEQQIVFPRADIANFQGINLKIITPEIAHAFCNAHEGKIKNLVLVGKPLVNAAPKRDKTTKSVTRMIEHCFGEEGIPVDDLAKDKQASKEG
jgi:hypothetical protein